MQEFLHGQGDENGDCFRASVASLFSLPLSEVPHFYRKGNEENALADFRAWLRAQGYAYLDLQWNAYSLPYLDGAYHLLTGPSPRFPEFNHCVLGFAGEIHHDPHPDGGGLGGTPEEEWFATIIFPLRPEGSHG